MKYFRYFLAILLWCMPYIGDGGYLVGGDDLRLYYLYPETYFRNFFPNIIGNNALGINFGYFPVGFAAPLTGVIFFVKQMLPMLNTQAFMYGLNYALAFLWSSAFFRQLSDRKSLFLDAAASACGLFYVLSPYLVNTIFQTQLSAVYLLSTIPGILYFYSVGWRKESYAYVVAAVLVYSILSSTVLSAPWFIPVLLCLIPYLLYLGIRKPVFTLKSLAVACVSFFLLNLYWIIHLLVPFIVPGDRGSVVSSLTDQKFRQENANMITAMTYLNGPVSQIFNTVRTSWTQSGRVTGIGLAGSIYLAVVFLGGMVGRRVNTSIRTVFLIAISCLALSMLLYTPNFGGWNRNLFEWAVQTIPFFVMFRNMYDKFAFALAFSYAFAVYGAILVLDAAFPKKPARWALVGLVGVVTLMLSWTFIRYGPRDRITQEAVHPPLNTDYQNLVSYIRNHPEESKYLWLPMTFPGYVYLDDSRSGGSYYVGPSPLRLFAGVNDVAGFYGISPTLDSGLNWRLLDALRSGSYAQAKELLKYQDIGFVILNHDRLPDAKREFLNGFSFFDLQTQEFLDSLLGEKIADFGDRYSLYYVNEDIRLPHAYIEATGQSGEEMIQPLDYRKSTDGSYTMQLPMHTAARLVLMEPYHPLWDVEQLDANTHTSIGFRHEPAYSYGNAWKLTTGESQVPKNGNKQDDTIRVRIQFRPRVLTYPAFLVSIIAFGILILKLIVILFLKRAYGKK